MFGDDEVINFETFSKVMMGIITKENVSEDMDTS
jgi:hypothetical protein